MTTVESKLRRTLVQPIFSASLFRVNASRGDISYLLEDGSCEAVCRIYPRRIKNLFFNLNLNQAALKAIKDNVDQRNWVEACKALLDYYRHSKSISWLNHSLITPSDGTHLQADLILQDIFTFQSATKKVQRHRNKLLDWNCQGPNHDPEWAWFLNRHYHLLDLFQAYQKTGNSHYIRCINNHIVDWIVSNPSRNSPQIWAQWRGLEAAYRLLHWAPLFYELQQVEEFTPAARLLMLASVADHAFYLRSSHDWGDNWVTREMIGLATAGLYWQEFKHSQRWIEYAGDRFLGAIQQQVYPDGAHKELTSHYHRIMLRDCQNFANLLHSSGRSVSPKFKARLEHTTNYLAYSLRPDGYCLLNNDSDLENNRDLLLNAATLYQRPDWTYIATNGIKGQQPQGEPSQVFPWAGQMVMRSGWDAEAHWAFFDVGPLGINYHIHQDKLHFALMAYGRDLLVDSGRCSYVRDQFWYYFRGSASHNVILVDGKGQERDIRQWRSPMTGNYAIEPEFDFARGVCDRGFSHLRGKLIHTRSVVYLRNRYWVVVDHIQTDRPRQIEPLWHFHPDCTVVVENESVKTIDPGLGNLCITPVADFPWQVKLVAGQTDPVQGWWSCRYNHRVPNPTASYSAQISTSATFAWVLCPAKGQVPQLNLTQVPAPSGTLRLLVEMPGEKADEIIVRMTENEPIQLSDDLRLEGNCAILRPGTAPLVAQGRLIRSNGTIVASHQTLSYPPRQKEPMK